MGNMQNIQVIAEKFRVNKTVFKEKNVHMNKIRLEQWFPISFLLIPGNPRPDPRRSVIIIL
jgi:hypothetical protein